MRTSRFVVIFLALLTFSNSKLFSQTNATIVAPVYSQDSLQGFDPIQANIQALGEGFYGQAYTNAINIYKRHFVINKYDLYKTLNNPIAGSSSGGKYGSATTANAPCTNEDFEAGTLAGWTASVGTNSNSQAYPTVTGPASASQASVMTTTITDPYVGSIPNSPLGGTKVVRINNNVSDFSVVKLSQTFPVTTTNYFFDFAYWAVMEDGGSSGPPHTCSQTPFMLIKIRDNNNLLQALCPTFSIVAPSSGSGGCTGLGPLTWSTVAVGTNTIKTSNGWQKFSIDLTPYLFTTPGNVTIEVFVGDCSLGGHWGYAYFDARCNTMDLTVNSQTLSLLTPTVYPQVLCGGTATMTAPSGMINYTWTGPPSAGIGTVTTQTLVTSVPGNYSLTMNPPGICNAISKIVNLQFVPPTTITASPANLCATGTNTSSTLTASGASQYTWAPGGSTLSSIVVTPTTTSIYTLTARTGTCTGTFTVQVTVNPDPVFNVVSSTSNLCPGQTATLTAVSSGSNTYVWNPGSMSGSVVVVSSANTYTTVGTSSAGCTATVTTTIGTSPAPNISILLLSPASAATSSVCPGTAITLAGLGGSIVWQPGGSTANPAIFNPTVTTTYTAIGSSGSCTGSATQLIMVDPGPSMTLSANPAITCPGNTTTLSAVAPSAVGNFTWNPGAVNATSIVVTPTIAGGYSVSAQNTAGCVNTQTINPTFSTPPTIVISPASPSVCAGGSVMISASGGVTYTWLPGNTNGASAVISPTSSATVYTVIGANAAGCVNQTTFNINVVPLPVINASVSPAAICAGSCATITPGGAFSYTVSPGGSTVVCPTITSVYSIAGTSAAGCVGTPVNVTVTVNPNPVVTASATPASICAGNTSNLSAGGALNYTWQPVNLTGSSITVTPAITTVYTVTGANASGCTSQTFVTVNVTPAPNVSVSPASATVCTGGTLSASASGATSYTWQPGGQTGASVILSPSGNTTYTVFGSTSGCIGQNTMVVTVTSPPVISATFVPGTICAGSCATLAPSGALTYTVSGLSAVACPTITTGYSVVGSDANGCTSNTVTGTLFVNSAPIVNASASPTSVCPGGSSNLSATGALNYTWQPVNLTGASISVTPATTTAYTVTGTNASGCTGTAVVTVVVNSVPAITISPSATTICQGSSVTLSASGATSYTWQPVNLNGSSISVSPTITTTYTAFGSNGSCSAQNTVVVTVAPNPTVNAPFTPTAICAGSCATLNPSGASSYVIAGLTNIACPAATSGYTVVGTSAAGCTGTFIGVLTVLALPNVSASASATSICLGGSSNLSATGALNYTWQPVNLTGSSISVTPAITTVYTVTGANASGCTSIAMVTVVVNSPPPIFAIASPTSICAGASVTLSAGGAGNYFWMPVALSGATVFVSPTITTTYTVTGNVGACTGSAMVTVVVNPVPTVNINASSTSICSGASVTLTPSGATTYSWSDGSTASTRVVSPSSNTTYNVIGFGPTGCASLSASITITVNPAPGLTASANPGTVCAGSSATLTASGATSYNWQPGNLSGSPVVVTPSVNTTYIVTGTLAGCTGTAAVTVFVSPGIILSAGGLPSTICSGGTASLNASGATNYTWLPGPLPSAASVTVSPSTTTTYTVIGNTGACTVQIPVTIFVNPTPTAGISGSTLLCAGSCATLTAFGASTYTWDNSSTGSTYVVCPTSTQSYSLVGANGSCTSSAFITIVVTPAPVITVFASANPICAGSSAVLSASGAVSYVWSTGSTSPSITVAPSTTTVYSVIGSSGSCTSSASYTLNVNPSANINIIASSPTVCAGYTVGLLATGAPSFTWLPNNVTTNPLVDQPLATTVYTAISNSGGCTASATISIQVSPLPVITLTASPPTLCTGQTTTLMASGGTTYSWIPSLVGGNTFTDTPLSTTVYTVVGFDPVGCPNYATISVNVVPAPVIFAASSSTAVCIGSSATLTASGATNYTWQPVNQTGSSIVVNPSAATVYTVFGDNGGCIGSTSIAVGVNPSPTISAVASSASICPGGTVALAASGGVTYTWMPPNTTGASIVDNPFVSTDYTVTGTDANGCSNTANVFVFVNPMANISAIASPSDVCQGGTVTLIGSGGLSYTWNPGSLPGGTVSVVPNASIVYTLMASDASGCTGSFTVPVNVVPNPTITITPVNYSVCIGSSATLTASGATNYTWLPSGTQSSVTIETPASFTTYTVIGDNAGLCFGSATVDVYVHQLPKNVAATSTGTIGCQSPTAQLFGVCSDTNVSYAWTGPAGYSSGAQNPVISGIWGDFTLSVTDNITGCVATATVNVPTDNTIPLVTAMTSGSITCAVSTVTLNAAHTTTNPGYSWTGPSGFTNTTQSPTVSLQGTYTIVVTDLSSTCTGSAVVTVGTHTYVTISASITPASCDGNGNSNNDGQISVQGFTLTDKYDVVSGTTYTGTAVYATAANIPTNGIITSNLANPSTTVAYTIRLFDGEGCVKDTTLYLVPVDCSLRTLGIAKAVSLSTVNADGSYDLTYTVVAKSYDNGQLSSISLVENLSNTFPAPTTFTVYPDSLKTIGGSSLALNTSFDGSTQTNLLTSSASNSLASKDSTVIQFRMRVKTSLFFIDFRNSVIGSALNAENKIVSDSSQTGMDPNPDADNNPYNNNVATVISFNPNQFFGITKVGEIHRSDDESFDVTYTITIHNLGNDTIRDVSLNDSLFGKTIVNPATYSMRSGPISAGGGLVANSSFNGNTDIRLINQAQSKMSPGTTASVYFTINVKPGVITSISNSAYGNALCAISASQNVIVSDTSGTGTNPDVNGNGNWNEAADNLPTVLLIPNTHTLFIPEGFSPDDDNLNQYFVIKGLPTTGDNSITIFNRWGNKVYYHANYDNTWDGTPNISGTLGKDKLPQGTYFYILEMKGSGQKPISGFVVLQY